MAKIINYITPLDEDNLNGGYYIVFVSDMELVDEFTAEWGEEISIIETIPTKDGYNFEGWKYTDDENPVNSGSTFTVTQDAVFTAQFSPACVHTYVNGVCTKCSHACIHNFVNGVCAICNISIGCNHTYLNGICTKCGYQCSNHTYSNGICTTCGYEHSPHSYNNSYSQYSASQHKAHCACGAFRFESHNFVDQSNAHGDTIRRCKDCDYTVTVTNTCSFTYLYESISPSQHKAYCICGNSQLESHTFNTSGKCTKCGYQCSNHTYSNGVCTICGYIHTPHSYNYSYSQYSSSQHRAYCSCGVSTLQSHTYDSTNTCIKCGYHVHSYTKSYSQNNSSTHFAFCACGDYITETHTFNSTNTCKCGYHIHSYTKSYSQNNSTTHLAYCVCGEYITEVHAFDSKKTCIKCGYHVHSYDHKYTPSGAKHLAYCICGDSKLEPHSYYMGSCSKCGFALTLDDGPN